MNQQHTKYYLEHNEDMRMQISIIGKMGRKIYRKTRKNHNLKITPEIEKFIKEHVRKYSTTTLWELYLKFI